MKIPSGIASSLWEYVASWEGEEESQEILLESLESRYLDWDDMAELRRVTDIIIKDDPAIAQELNALLDRADEALSYAECASDYL